MHTIKVHGKKNRNRVLLYAISACPWCNKEKQLLRDGNIEFEYVDVDLCNDEDYEMISEDIANRGARFSFPTIIIDEGTVITGFKENKIRESLEI